ncbi:undecaprenyldiphospho-muramoylpentapeptide beta-N-acetylglucosaminyltransferase [Allofrancisella guangzhouensis]|uniref:UDP-N-acetylglucosamine--N-acetylmuramyl-(pentapeptide) pyrophosphoryl-undecaprenol N-acetylglucosamine transferase n=1 Tax=Allofrancisella guangzhouensis TaxID=594679 RepID=A0A0A8EAT5_9GAMM|nr:undecaprenyldiphospho-muramoylpentapeptide beta-N-acetylglucosaminyltransferase [Allofrancisella guangzhouensis]AJC49296.1 UDP-diphospho-muramoylpentapeptide beta-N-acetylglucosaminyltransferase [Allofrancisella guangzhouensis]MBK2027193.1 undecaprenyldiphospho-muramoylpentapeptide beta-N-acetylglucosaminyltransferase [Allofrancisella guangzhouensis]MBK2044629.1 undecaprenyldiphospho-muramoylpentapeptide beta-N-acetylglucosaminyltransferase [Allofrancisella guangzhouensis]MBK2045088.1 undeca
MDNLTNKNIIIAAGGTGGHIYPAVAVAELLNENGANITWVGTPNSMEAKLVTGIFDIKYIKTAGIRRKNVIKKLFFPLKLTISSLKAYKILRETKADLVIGFGGYVSGPVCLAAKLKKIPVVIHEQNAKIGLTNRVLAKLADRICLAFEIDNIKSYFNPKQLAKTTIVGNPVRKDILNLNTIEKNFSHPELRLLILGGSQGAKAINDIIPKLILESKKHDINIKVWHQTGALLFDQTQANYAGISQENIKEISAFIFDMAAAYKWADLVICRAGALTVSECAIAGLPTIFIPFPSAVDDHQFFNAQIIVKNNAGFCIRQDQMDLEKLISIIKPLVDDHDKLITLSNNAKKTLIKNSSEQILEYIKEVLH